MPQTAETLRRQLAAYRRMLAAGVSAELATTLLAQIANTHAALTEAELREAKVRPGST